MTKLLHFALLLVFLLSANSLWSQEDKLKEMIGQYDNHIVSLEKEEFPTIPSFFEKEDFSYSKCFGLHRIKKNHDKKISHKEGITWIDIISADEGADFNCSGGFCMHESHFHKRGLTLRKQLFDYFMRISC
ncbi:hypothetical protein [Aquimarina litoralis]|uniref:hypothetical protein n=1 Tax=Aquimarina litoralis TaxID=584605 RepID=UPI001C5A11DB|nr:hypothetical protein [Aquimarina litoralis]MBW1296771.1 hypothetical protein [Aquimarina litoralis]